jgi:hypothetical protein
MDRLIVPSTLLMQEKIDLTQDKVTTLEEANFFL